MCGAAVLLWSCYRKLQAHNLGGTSSPMSFDYCKVMLLRLLVGARKSFLTKPLSYQWLVSALQTLVHHKYITAVSRITRVPYVHHSEVTQSRLLVCGTSVNI